jgi:anti-sigma regulatory factor (Ser/Thr protein kinase)
MLQHSRTSTSQKEPTDINVLCDEYCRLAFHGMRAKDKSFNAEVKTQLSNILVPVNVIRQDIGRVVLNLINNALYAVDKKAKKGLPSYKPEVLLTTSKTGNNIEIKIKDNGDGIPDSLKEKIFQPFFTTKPTGEGTGLGLSLSLRGGLSLCVLLRRCRGGRGRLGGGRRGRILRKRHVRPRRHPGRRTDECNRHQAGHGTSAARTARGRDESRLVLRAALHSVLLSHPRRVVRLLERLTESVDQARPLARVHVADLRMDRLSLDFL